MLLFVFLLFKIGTIKFTTHVPTSQSLEPMICQQLSCGYRCFMCLYINIQFSASLRCVTLQFIALINCKVTHCNDVLNCILMCEPMKQR